MFPKHALFSFYRNSRKALICTHVHLSQQCEPIHAFTPVLDLVVYIQKAVTSKIINKDFWAGGMVSAGCSCRGLQLSFQHPQSSSQLAVSHPLLASLGSRHSRQCTHTCKQHTRIHKIKITLSQDF